MPVNFQNFTTLNPKAAKAIQRTMRMAMMKGAEDVVVETLQTTAEQCFSDVISTKAGRDVKSMLEKIAEKDSIEGAAISLGVSVIQGAVGAIQARLNTVRQEREALQDEIERGVVVFPTSQSQQDDTVCFMNDYVQLASDPTMPWLKRYLGIQEKNGEHHFIPYHKSTERIPDESPDINVVAAEKSSINRFLRGQVQEGIDALKLQADTTYSFNYLRLSIGIRESLSVLLWSLEEMYDMNGNRLSLEACARRCKQAEDFLIRLLDSRSAPYLDSVIREDDGTRWFIMNVRNYIKRLRTAYTNHQLNQIRFTDLIDGGYRSVKTFMGGLFQLMYEGTSETNEVVMATDIELLNMLLGQSDEVFRAFEEHGRGLTETIPTLNRPLATVIDVLTVFCYITDSERKACIEELGASQAASLLSRFNQRFILPLELQTHTHSLTLFPRQAELDRQDQDAGGKLLPFITLLIATLQLNVDTQRQLENQQFLSSKAQAQRINKEAYEGGHSSYGGVEIEAYRLLQLTILTKHIDNILNDYEDYQNNENFKRKVITCLNRLKSEYIKLDTNIEQLEGNLSNLHMLSVLRPILGILNDSLGKFEAHVSHLLSLMSNASTSTREREHPDDRLLQFEALHQSLFSEESGFSDVLNPQISSLNPQASPQALSNQEQNNLESLRIFTLKKLCGDCHDAMSYWSRSGHKGELLRRILHDVGREPYMDEAQALVYLKDIIRVVSSYRQAWFFQAEYGETRSAQALISAMKSPQFNLVLPIKKALFGDTSVRLEVLTDDEFVARLQDIRKKSIWEEDECLIDIEAFRQHTTAQHA